MSGSTEPGQIGPGQTGPGMDIRGVVAGASGFKQLAEAMDAGRRVVATGSAGSSAIFAAAALAERTSRAVLLVLAHIDDADEAIDELESVGASVTLLPASEVVPGETGLAADLLGQRLAAARRIASLKDGGPGERQPHVIVAPMAALMQSLPDADRVEALLRTVRKGDQLDPGDLIKWLGTAGYSRVDAIEEAGDFAVRGGIVDVFPPAGAILLSQDGEEVAAQAAPVRLDFFGDEVDRISEIDLETMGSDRAVAGVELVAASMDAAAITDGGVSPVDLLPASSLAIIAETLEVVEQGRGYFERTPGGRGVSGPPAVLKKLESRPHALAEINQFSAGPATADVQVGLGVEALAAFDKDAGTAVNELLQLDAGRVLVACQNAGERERFAELLEAAGGSRAVTAIDRYVHRGFVVDGDGCPRRGGAVSRACAPVRGPASGHGRARGPGDGHVPRSEHRGLRGAPRPRDRAVRGAGGHAGGHGGPAGASR